MGVGSSKKREEEKKAKEEQEKKEKLEQAKKDLQLKVIDLESKLDQLNTQAKSFQEQAKKKLAEGDKIKAKHLLSKKKRCMEQVEKINGALMMMDDQLFMIENTEIFGGVTGAIKQATDVLKVEQGKVSVSRIESLTNSIRSLKEKNDEVNKFMEDIKDDALEDLDVEDDFLKLENEVNEELPDSNKEKIEYEGNQKIKQRKLMEA